jgi:hypothetical protein
MNRGDGTNQVRIVVWLQEHPTGGSTVDIACGVYGVITRDEMSDSQYLAVRRSLKRLRDLGRVELCAYQTHTGYACWRLVKEAIPPIERPRNKFEPLVHEGGKR